jgi:ferredoxin
MYGVIPGGIRSSLHGEYPRNEEFSQMLVDVFSLVRPQLTIMDGVMAMEGEGPAAGRLRRLGILLASRDTVALDAITSRILGIDPQMLLTTHYAGERGLGISDTSKIIVMGEKVESISIQNFKLPISMSQPKLTMIPQAVAHFAIEQLAPRPYVIKKNCTACSACVKVCPTGAATIIGKTADINKKLCIKCMCCHEACRFNAIVPRRPFSGSLIFGIMKIWRKGTRK